MQKLVRHYNEKHNIQIIFNGDTEYGKQKIAIAQAEIQKKIANYNDEKKKYATYLQAHWLDEAARYIPDGYYIGWDRSSDFRPYHQEIKAKISPFLARDSTIWEVKFKELSTAEFEQLNEIGKQLSCKSLLEDRIDSYIQHLKSQYHDVCLSIEETLEEIKSIQASLKNDEVVGYYWTNNHRVLDQHFEGFILTAEKKIRLLDYSPDLCKLVYSVSLYGSRLEYLVEPESEGRKRNVILHVGNIECATFAFLMLKEHLKNNAAQFRHFSLSFPYYHTPSKTIYYLFLPSPHVLRYSESGFSNKVFAALLEDTDSASFEHLDNEITHRYTVTTLKNLLTKSITIAKEKKNLVVEAENQKILDNLPAFSQSWLKEYAVATLLRDSMKKENRINQYLTYRTHSMQKAAERYEDTTTQLSRIASNLPQANAVLKYKIAYTEAINSHKRRKAILDDLKKSLTTNTDTAKIFVELNSQEAEIQLKAGNNEIAEFIFADILPYVEELAKTHNDIRQNVLYRYARFLIEYQNNSEKAMQLLTTLAEENYLEAKRDIIFATLPQSMDKLNQIMQCALEESNRGIIHSIIVKLIAFKLNNTTYTDTINQLLYSLLQAYATDKDSSEILLLTDYFKNNGDEQQRSHAIKLSTPNPSESMPVIAIKGGVPAYSNMLTNFSKIFSRNKKANDDTQIAIARKRDLRKS